MTPPIAERRLPGGQRILLIHGDLTEQRVDAIVNAANAQLMHGGGVAGAIARRGGPSIQAESDAWVRQHGPASAEHPALTGAGDLPCRYVIHTVGPVWGEGDEDARLHRAVTSALALAEDLGLASLALPAISTGIYGFPLARAAPLLIEAVESFLDARPASALREVRITLFDPPALQAFRAAFERAAPPAA